MNGKHSFDIRFWKTRTYTGKSTTTYYVRWKVAGRLYQRGFQTKALAEIFRSELVAAARSGEAFLNGDRPACFGRAPRRHTDALVRVRVLLR